MRLASIAVLLSLSACAASLPPGQENTRTFSQHTPIPYRDVYRLVAKQMRFCYRTRSALGNGYDIQADLDSETKTGRIELYSVSLSKVDMPSDSVFSRTVEIKGEPTGSTIIVTGTTPKYVYLTHRSISIWLGGDQRCPGLIDL